MKPGGLGSAYAAQFDDPSIVASYSARPPYPESLVSLILDLAGPPPVRLLDLGCGTGELARRLSPRVDAISAVERSERMIMAARAMSGGDSANIEWVVGPVEEVELSDHFSVALAAESFHWFDWPRACLRVAELVPSAVLVIVEGRFEERAAWEQPLASLIADFSTNREYEAYDLIEELRRGGWLTITGRTRLGPERFEQTTADYVTSIHSRNGFSRDRMSPDAARDFDAAVSRLVAPHSSGGILELSIETRVSWGRVSTETASSRS